MEWYPCFGVTTRCLHFKLFDQRSSLKVPIFELIAELLWSWRNCARLNSSFISDALFALVDGEDFNTEIAESDREVNLIADLSPFTNRSQVGLVDLHQSEKGRLWSRLLAETLARKGTARRFKLKNGSFCLSVRCAYVWKLDLVEVQSRPFWLKPEVIYSFVSK